MIRKEFRGGTGRITGFFCCSLRFFRPVAPSFRFPGLLRWLRIRVRWSCFSAVRWNRRPNVLRVLVHFEICSIGIHFPVVGWLPSSIRPHFVGFWQFTSSARLLRCFCIKWHLLALCVQLILGRFEFYLKIVDIVLKVVEFKGNPLQLLRFVG